jgi:glycine/D-amino acid oxidase-like deaminating enzyme
MRHADVVVIGAGSVGANVAYRLAARGAGVTVLDAGAPGAGTSGVSFAWTNSFNKTPLNPCLSRDHVFAKFRMPLRASCTLKTRRD